jgi:MFS family permease
LKNPVGFVIAVSAMGVFSASLIPVYSAMATLSPEEGHGRGIGRFWTAASLGFGSASFIGGVVYEFLGVNYLFVVGALYGYVGFLIMLSTPRENFTLSRPIAFSKGYWGVLRDRNLRTLCILSIIILVASSAFNSFFTLYLVATGTTTLGAVAYRFVGPLNDRLGRKPVFLLGTLGYTAYFGALYLVTNPIVVTVLWVLPIYPLIQSSAAALASDFTSTADRGKGLGILESSLSLGGGIGPLAGGLIADASQFQSIIVFSLAASILSTIGSQIFLKKMPRTEQVAPMIHQHC